MVYESSRQTDSVTNNVTILRFHALQLFATSPKTNALPILDLFYQINLQPNLHLQLYIMHFLFPYIKTSKVLMLLAPQLFLVCISTVCMTTRFKYTPLQRLPSESNL
uniref:Uncharacterized protein n=1 Tax=Glossina brevipalpis TaxID=37001 RepID=A0A1A9WQ17_9MUSC